MALKDYEYFGNQKGLNNSVLAGRYGRGQVYGQRLQNDAKGQEMWAKDPWFMLGSSLGRAWADNYIERGVQNGINDARAALDGAGIGNAENPNPPQQQPTPDYRQNAINEQTAKSLGDFASGINDKSVLPKQEQQLGLGAVQPPLSAKQQAAKDIIDGYKNEFQFSNNPRGDATQAQVTTSNLKQLLETPDYDPLSKRRAIEQAIANRPAYQQKIIMQELAPDLKASEEQYNQKMATQLANAGFDAVQNQNFADAQKVHSRLMRIDPQSANALQKRLDYAIGRRDRRADIEDDRAYKRAMRDEERAYREARGIGVGGRRTTTGAGTTAGNGGNATGSDYVIGARAGIDQKEYENAKKRVVENKGNAYDEDVVKRYESDPNHGKRSGWRPNNQGDVYNIFRGLGASLNGNGGMTYMQVAREIAAQGYDKSPYAREAAQAAGIDLDYVYKLLDKENWDEDTEFHPV